MIEVRDINGKLLYTDTEHSDTSELWCEGADLRNADFRGWDLSYAYFSECDLRGARFDEADLSNAMLSACELEGASFRDAVMTYANVDCVDWWYSEHTIDTEGAELPYVRNRAAYM